MTEAQADLPSVTSSAAYQRRLLAEIEHYAAEFDNEESRRTLVQRVPPSWHAVEAKAEALIRQANGGRDLADEVVAQLRAYPGGRALSIGSGPGGVELGIARRLTGCECEFICLDLNPHLVELGRERATAEGLNVKFEVQDINELSLAPEQFDIIMCHASLHHLINLEHIFYEMNRALKPQGKLVVVEVITRNGYLMWDETYALVRALWKVLPERFKYNHSAYATVQLDTDVENRDYGSESMECARSQDIVPLLSEYFTCQVFIPYFALCRRFFDTMYGPNFDLTRGFDRSILEFIWQLDIDAIAQGRLQPETMFGVYTKGPERIVPHKHSEVGTSKRMLSNHPENPPLPYHMTALPPVTPLEAAVIRPFLRLSRSVRRTKLYQLLQPIIRRTR